jgi:hypothetical protein
MIERKFFLVYIGKLTSPAVFNLLVCFKRVNKLVEELNVIMVTTRMVAWPLETRKTRTWARGGCHVDSIGHRAAESQVSASHIVVSFEVVSSLHRVLR